MGTLRDIGRALGAWAGAVVLNGFIVGLLYMVGFAIAGVPAWFVVGAICGLINIVPQIGGVLSLAFVALVTLAFTPGWSATVAASIVWVIVQTIEGFVLAPRAAGRAGISPLFSIVLVIAAGLLLGPIGAILAVPVVAVLLIVYRTARKRT